MSNLELAYLSLVILGFLTFAIGLAWVSWWSRRDGKSDHQAHPPALKQDSDTTQTQTRARSRAF
jgi:hypothetical protein